MVSGVHPASGFARVCGRVREPCERPGSRALILCKTRHRCFQQLTTERVEVKQQRLKTKQAQSQPLLPESMRIATVFRFTKNQGTTEMLLSIHVTHPTTP